MNMQIADEEEKPKGSRSEIERQEQSHTPTPWRLHKHGIQSMGGGIVYTAGGAHRLVQIEGPDEETVGRLEVLVFGDDDSPGMSKLAANARFIVRAVNNHEALVKAIEAEACRRAIDSGLGVSEWRAFLWPEARAALASIDSQ
jgi:hypothetical protein